MKKGTQNLSMEQLKKDHETETSFQVDKVDNSKKKNAKNNK